MESGLQKIYLHHSYFKGKFTEVECVGHTNNMGTNGAGKSTMLSLIPFFYGKEPSSLVNRAGEKKAFADFLLPSMRSMLIFEYKRLGELKCVVMYKSKKSVAYRFVDCSAEGGLFQQHLMDQLVGTSDVHDWLRHVVSKHFYVSNQIGSSIDYRAVLLNDKKRLQKKRKSHQSLSSTAYQFSLCSNDTQMQHIDSLTAVMLRHDKLLAQFKTMVVDSFLSDQIDIGEAPFHIDDAEYINSLNVLVEIEKHSATFHDALDKDVELREQWSLLLAYKKQLDQAASKVELNLITTEALIKDLGIQTGELEYDYKSKTAALRERYNNEYNALEGKNSLIQTIYDERERWDGKENITTKISQYEQLSDYEVKMNSDSEHYKGLLEAVSQQADAHQIKIGQLETDTTNKLSKAKEDLSTLDKSMSEHLRLAQQRQNDRSDEMHVQIREFLKSRASEKQRINDDIQAFYDDKTKASLYSEDENKEISSYENQISEIDEQLVKQAIYISEKREQLDTDTKLRDGKLDELDLKKKALGKAEKEREKITRQLNPEPDSLHEFLNDTKDSWRDTIGKVIRPELLNQKNLNPQFVDGSQALYGLEINLNLVEQNEFTKSENQLKQQREALKKDILNYEEDITRIKTELGKLNKQVSQSEKDLSQLGREEEGLKNEKKEIGLSVKAKKIDIERAINNRVGEIDKRIQHSILELKAYDHETDSGVEKLEETAKQEILTLKANASVEEAAIQEQIDLKGQLIKDIKATAGYQLKELEDTFEAILKNRGIDPLTEQVAKERAAKSKSKYELIKSYTQLINDYRSWEKSLWVHIDKHEKEATELSASVARLSSQLEDKKKKYQERLKELEVKTKEHKAELGRLEREQKSINNAYEDVNDALEKVPTTHKSTEIRDNLSLELLLERLTRNINRIKVLRRSIADAVKKVGEVLTSIGSKNKVYVLWENMEQDRSLRSIHANYTEDFFIEGIDDVRRLLEVAIPDIREVTLESLKTVGERYVRFYHSLDTLNRKVRSISSTLGEEINTTNHFEALSDINVELVSKVDEFDIWKDLKAFSEVWSKWMESDRNVLPSKEFVTIFRSTTDSLRSCQISNDIESLVDIDISMRENGRPVNIRTDADLKGLSSEGISTLAVIVVFCGMTRYLCKDSNVRIHWPLDELGKISDENVMILFELMDEHNISLFCAQPNPSPVLLRFFTTKNYVDKNLGIKRYVSVKGRKQNPLLPEEEDK
ncbi:ATP-binding protein [Vibrio parahaemolyticus]|nr:ATP-binding protein [Vibrio parahaemolyticus]MDF5499974.1 ATP-binding protein [Vibrio parahaemolyticus]MDF5510708.1 ATP-binding protein [Vibrio parahaemolyticus]MDF5558416.1 ATP-binding protein [Vibrio parahaemolyticus]